MVRALVLAMLILTVPRAAALQTVSVLHVKVVLADADGRATAVPRHVLLVSENPTSALPRRITTALDGTAEIRLRSGNYTVESERPVAFQGKAYQWTEMVDIVEGRDAVLELTASNAETGSLTAADASGAPADANPAFILTKWQDSVVAIWTPTARVSGFAIDPKGLIATSQRAIGTATAVEVQLTPAVKVAGRVLVADAERDVALVQVDSQVLAAVTPVPLSCAETMRPVAAGEPLFAIGSPLRGPTDMVAGTIRHVYQKSVLSNLVLPSGSTGGPAFSPAGEFLGLTTPGITRDEDARIVRRETACEVVASSTAKVQAARPPDGTRLPVEPAEPVAADALEKAAKLRAGNLRPHQVTSDNFDIGFMTPVQVWSAYTSQRSQLDFANWSDYVADFPAVLFVRVTPRQVESFWTTVARQAARTQGVELPPIKRFKAGFARMRVLCGDTDVTPIHPFRLEQRLKENEAIYEGLYVLDPAAIAPHCGSVKLVLFSEKQPDKGDTVVVDPKIVEQVWQDFAAYRALKPGAGL